MCPLQSAPPYHTLKCPCTQCDGAWLDLVPLQELRGLPAPHQSLSCLLLIEQAVERHLVPCQQRHRQCAGLDRLRRARRFRLPHHFAVRRRAAALQPLSGQGGQELQRRPAEVVPCGRVQHPPPPPSAHRAVPCCAHLRFTLRQHMRMLRERAQGAKACEGNPHGGQRHSLPVQAHQAARVSAAAPPSLARPSSVHEAHWAAARRAINHASHATDNLQRAQITPQQFPTGR